METFEERIEKELKQCFEGMGYDLPFDITTEENMIAREMFKRGICVALENKNSNLFEFMTND